jgi:hypothetical protein
MFTADVLSKARSRMKFYADRKRSPIDTFKVGDLVLLNCQDIPTNNSFSKLNSPFAGPFPVTRIISDTTVELRLPESSRLHPVFHVSKLERFVQRPGSVATDSSPSSNPLKHLEIEPAKVAKPIIILEEKVRYGKTQFLVRFSSSILGWMRNPFLLN